MTPPLLILYILHIITIVRLIKLEWAIFLILGVAGCATAPGLPDHDRQPSYVFQFSQRQPTTDPTLIGRHGYWRARWQGNPQRQAECSSIDLGNRFFLTAAHCLVSALPPSELRRMARCLHQGGVSLPNCVSPNLIIEWRRGALREQHPLQFAKPLYWGARSSEVRHYYSGDRRSLKANEIHDYLLFTITDQPHPSSVSDLDYSTLLDPAAIQRITHRLHHPMHPVTPCGDFPGYRESCRHNGMFIAYPGDMARNEIQELDQMTAANCTIYTAPSVPAQLSYTCSSYPGASGGGLWSAGDSNGAGIVLLGMGTGAGPQTEQLKPGNTGLRLDYILNELVRLRANETIRQRAP